MPSAEADMEKDLAWIPWREPWEVTLRNTGHHVFICRFCAALYGVELEDLDKLYHTREEWESHLASFHPREESDRANR